MGGAVQGHLMGEEMGEGRKAEQVTGLLLRLISTWTWSSRLHHQLAALRRHNSEGLTNKPRQQHVASPSTPVCPSKGQNKIQTALFSWKEGHGVSLPGHLLQPCGMLSKARQFQGLRAGLSGRHSQSWGLIKHQLDPVSLCSPRHTLLLLASSV